MICSMGNLSWGVPFQAKEDHGLAALHRHLAKKNKKGWAWRARRKEGGRGAVLSFH
jgi:hypothetical protein